jgi:GDP-D-mannose 3',5'-epimerase
MGQDANILVTGAGGFIGHHLTRYLVAKGYFVRGVDVKFPQYELSPAAEFRILDLRRWENCLEATRDMDHIYHLAANMGGIGFIETNKAAIVHDNTLIDTHMLEAARIAGVSRFLCASSACIIPDTCRTPRMWRHSGKRTPTRPTPRTATAGRSSWPSGCAATTTRTTV